MQEQKEYTYMSLFDEITSILNQVICVASRYNHDTLRDQMKTMIENINNMRHTRIVLVGNFATGKSSILNALLGKQVTPTYYLTSHCMPCIVKYGNESEILLHFNKEISQNNLESLPASVREHIRVNSEVPIPPLSIKIDEIENYTSFDILQKCQNYPPYSAVEVRLTNDFLRNDVEIVEFSGIGYNVVNSVTCIEPLNSDDIVIMTMSACHLCSMSEMDFIEYQLKERSITPIFVITHFDNIKAERDRDLVRKFAQMKLSSYSPYEIIFVDTNQSQYIDEIFENTNSEQTNIDPLKQLLLSAIQNRSVAFLKQIAIDAYSILEHGLNDTTYSISSQSVIVANVIQTLNDWKTFISKGVNEGAKHNESVMKHIVEDITDSILQQLPHWIDSCTTIGFIIPTRQKIVKVVDEMSCFIEKKINESFRERINESILRETERMFYSTTHEIECKLLRMYKRLEHYYSIPLVQQIVEYRIKIINEGFYPESTLPSITIRDTVNASPYIDTSKINCKCMHTIIPVAPRHTIKFIKKEVSSCYTEFIKKKTPEFVSNVTSAFKSLYTDFGNIIFSMLQEDINTLKEYSIEFNKIIGAVDSYRQILENLNIYINRLHSNK